MALVNSKKTFDTTLIDLSGVLSYFANHFEGKGYTVSTEDTASGAVISLTKGGLFKSVSGLKTGLNITFTQNDGSIDVAMEVGIFGKQLLPSTISMLVFWPMIFTQIYGLIRQNNLDKEAYQVILDAIRHCESHSNDRPDSIFCPYCGKQIRAESMFCPCCGKNVSDEIVCPNCGASVDKDSVFCPKCGTKIT